MRATGSNLVGDESRVRLPISVVIPLYNKEGTVGRCLESVGQQTQLPAEIVIVDDQCTDKSVEAAQQVAESSVVPIRFVHATRNSGPGAARNIGVQNTKYPWIAFLDADDYWLPEFCERIWQAVESSNATFGGTGYVIHDTRGNAEKKTLCVLAPRFSSSADVEFWRASLSFFPITSSTALVCRSSFDSVGGFPEDVRNYEDVTLWARLWLEGRFAFANTPLAVYDRIPGGITSSRKSDIAVRRYLMRLAQVVVGAAAKGRRGTAWATIFLLRSIAVWPVSAARTLLLYR